MTAARAWLDEAWAARRREEQHDADCYEDGDERECSRCGGTFWADDANDECEGCRRCVEARA